MPETSDKARYGLAAGAAIGSAAIAAAVLFSRRKRTESVDGIDVGITRWLQQRREGGRERSAPAAMITSVAEAGAAVVVRDAGPAHIRDGNLAGEWGRVDEQSDESFPASDPPSSY